MEPGSDYHYLVREMGLEPTRRNCHYNSYNSQMAINKGYLTFLL
nr:MAG TPA: hypothetical protein [Caudoviricetes sp.]